MKYWIFAILAIFCAFPATAQDKCIRTLIQDRNELNLREWSSLAAFRLYEQSRSSSSGSGADLKFPIEGVPVQAGYSETRKEADHTFDQSSLNWSQERLVSVATQTLSAQAVAAYRACKEGERASGPTVTVHNATRESATVTIRWIAPPGASTIGTLEVAVLGGSFSQPFPPSLGNNQSVSRILIRAKNRDLRLVVNIGGEEDNVFVSQLPPDTISRPVDRIGPTRWGGAYDGRGNDCVSANPATGICGCPTGYTASDMSDAGLVMCFALANEPVTMRFLFGGAYDPDGGGCNTGNPLTGACSCPASYRVLDLSDAGVHLCYADPGASVSVEEKMGGAYDMQGGSCRAGNIALNGSCGCPANYIPLDLSQSGWVICHARIEQAKVGARKTRRAFL